MPHARLDREVDKIDATLPPTALGLSLLEIYYARICNAPVLFPKPLLFQEYLAGAIPGYLLKGLFANATLYIPLNFGRRFLLAHLYADFSISRK